MWTVTNDSPFGGIQGHYPRYFGPSGLQILVSSQNRSDRFSWRVRVASVVIVMGAVLLGTRYAQEPWTPMRIAGAVIGLPSLLLLLLARIELGGAFSVRPKAQALVTHGLYSWMRNPIYFFGAITIAGFFSIFIGHLV